ncbi:MAG: ATP-binding protein, partial [Proteobacteria bacterium]|nr:ATP-binding protein [Pseudomonadota bacterium]
MAKFKTRARTVDMLGRQQIAGIATAISELFKNAHDAYAENVEVDYFKSDALFVLRDNGYGMTLEDFEDRWLTLGTESKLDIGHGLGSSYVPKGMKARPIMGEKGIGRLAIALIGPQVLVLTRAERNGRLHDLVAVFIHWGPFTIPGINLEDIDIPIHTFPNGKLPTQKDISKLVDQVKNNIKDLSTNYPDIESFNTILSDLDSVRLDPVEIDMFLGGLSLIDSGYGTHFYIVPADEYLEAEIESERRTEQRQFTNFLIGFSNRTFTDEDEVGIKTAFRYWESDQDCQDLIETNEFFTKEELAKADHRIQGRFDEFGQFNGTVRIYDAEPYKHVVAWPQSSGRKTLCGPFEIDFGYIQGTIRDTQMAPDEWAVLKAKTDKIGGLYVYRNGLRILPYGLSNYDWLDMEIRRGKHASYYFFSYRRVFGAVKIDKECNKRLVEKAGREGFQENKAYRQFRDILINFFIQLAADFFRREANISTYFEEKRLELDRIGRARQKREKQATTKRRNFSESLDNFFKKTEEGLAELEISNLNDFVMRQMRSASQIKNPDKASKALLDAEVAANFKLEKIRESFRITKPRGIGLTKQLRRDWDDYS